MTQVADRLAAASLLRPRRITRRLAIAAAAAVLLAALVIAVPRVLDPVCGDWFGAPPFRALQRVAQAAHHAVVR
jgi:ferric-dicitrate binding protein FerR (iron transport regulator)